METSMGRSTLLDYILLEVITIIHICSSPVLRKTKDVCLLADFIYKGPHKQSTSKQNLSHNVQTLQDMKNKSGLRLTSPVCRWNYSSTYEQIFTDLLTKQQRGSAQFHGDTRAVLWTNYWRHFPTRLKDKTFGQVNRDIQPQKKPNIHESRMI